MDDAVLGIIVGRGGSKGLPGKNLRELAGKPLIAWSIEAAAQSKILDRAIVSTDDAQIADVARRWQGDVPFLRPAELATDTAPIVDTIFHAVDTLAQSYRYIVLLQPTSPLRLGSDIDDAFAVCRQHGAPACISVTPAPKAHWALEMDASGRLAPLLGNMQDRRQDLSEIYQPNGAVYIAELEWLRTYREFYRPETVGHVMPPERSVDIDTMLDFLLAEAILKHRTGGDAPEGVLRPGRPTAGRP